MIGKGAAFRSPFFYLEGCLRAFTQADFHASPDVDITERTLFLWACLIYREKMINFVTRCLNPKKMKKFLLVAVFLVTAVQLFAEKPYKVQLGKTVLRGNVSKVVEGNIRFYEEWGEVKQRMDTMRVSLYDDNGRMILSIGRRAVSKYSYLSDGRVSKIDYFSKKNGPFEELPLMIDPKFTDLYEYEANGRIKSITLISPERGTGEYYGEVRSALYYDGLIGVPYEIEDCLGDDSYKYQYECSKIIYKYNSDDTYGVYVCNEQGKTIYKNDVLKDGQIVINSWGACAYDERGRLIEYGAQVVANNGAFSYHHYLGYNNKGDLAIESGKELGTKEIDIAPWLSTEYSYSGDRLFEYEYDAEGNWITRKEYEVVNRDIKKETGVYGRIIEYGNFFDLDALLKRQDNQVKAAIRAENEYVEQQFAQLRPTRYDDLDMFKIVEKYKEYQGRSQEYANNSASWSRSEKKAKYKEIQLLGSELLSLANLRSYELGEWYVLLAYIWGDFLGSTDKIASNYWVAMDALDAAEEARYSGSAIEDLRMKYNRKMPSSSSLEKLGLTEGQEFTAHCSGLETPTKVRIKDERLTEQADFKEREFRSDYKR